MLTKLPHDRARDRWDTLVVGAGPAGLFAARALAGAGQRVLVIDAGPDVDDRRRDGPSASSGLRNSYEQGVGGAGLFSDGKLCLSLDVGGHLETALDERNRRLLLRYVDRTFRSYFDGHIEARADRGLIAEAQDRAASVGLGFKYYPVAHVGTDRLGDVVIRLRNGVESSGAEIRAEHELIDLEQTRPHEWRALVEHSHGLSEIRAANVVLAMGKVGAARQASFCRALGVSTSSQRLYVGVRFETTAERLEPLFALNKDPKYRLELPDGSKIKTHCASDNGEVITLRYDGLPLAGGHNYSAIRSGRSGFSVLWDGLSPGGDSYGQAREIMSQASRLSGQSLLVQRLADYWDGRASGPGDLDMSTLSCGSSVPGDLRPLLPSAYWEAFDKFVERLNRLTPGLRSEDAVMYAPAIEWWMERISVDHSMATAHPGLYACGDGSGWSQGIVHAAATGVLAAEGVLGGHGHGGSRPQPAWRARSKRSGRLLELSPS